MPILTPQRLQQHRLETEGEGPGARTSLVSSNSEAVAARSWMKDTLKAHLKAKRSRFSKAFAVPRPFPRLATGTSTSTRPTKRRPRTSRRRWTCSQWPLNKNLEQCGDAQDGRRSQPVLRLVRRTRLDMIWETLDDPNSSKKAWWISQLQSCLVMATIVVGTLEAWRRLIESISKHGWRKWLKSRSWIQ